MGVSESESEGEGEGEGEIGSRIERAWKGGWN